MLPALPLRGPVFFGPHPVFFGPYGMKVKQEPESRYWNALPAFALRTGDQLAKARHTNQMTNNQIHDLLFLSELRD